MTIDFSYAHNFALRHHLNLILRPSFRYIENDESHWFVGRCNLSSAVLFIVEYSKHQGFPGRGMIDINMEKFLRNFFGEHEVQ